MRALSFIGLVFVISISSTEVFSQLLKTRFGSVGLEELSYNGTELLNTTKNHGQGLTVEDYVSVDVNGKISASNSQLLKSSLDTKRSIVTNNYNWGTITGTYLQLHDTLRITLKLTNTTKSDTLYGVNVFPLNLKFPKRPEGWQPMYVYYHNNIGAPTIIQAVFNKSQFYLCNDDVTKPLYVGMIDKRLDDGSEYKVWVSEIKTAGISSLAPAIEKKLVPNQSAEYSISLRFTSIDNKSFKPLEDLLTKFKTAYPYQVKWTDRRPIGSLILSSFENKSDRNNPRGWLPNSKINVLTVEGRSVFHTEILKYADVSIAILKSMNAQGMITWDLEGQEFPHTLSYIGSPEKLSEIAPEMVGVVDAYFKRFRDAGLKVGVCLRPDSVNLSKDKKRLTRIADNQFQQLARKINFARNRWGCTLFYIDSNGDPNFPSDASIFKRLNSLYPDILLIPEHQNIQYYGYSAPYKEWQSISEGMSSLISEIYPEAFNVINVANWISSDKNEMQVSQPKLLKAVRKGNILMFRGWYDEVPVNQMIKQAYKNK